MAKILKYLKNLYEKGDELEQLKQEALQKLEIVLAFFINFILFC